MNGYTIIVKAARAVLVVVVCLLLSGCESLWLSAYRAQGGYGKEPTVEEWRELQRNLNRPAMKKREEEATKGTRE
jgi:uncharacterized protein YceK